MIEPAVSDHDFSAIRSSVLWGESAGNDGNGRRDWLARGGIMPRRARISGTTPIPNQSRATKQVYRYTHTVCSRVYLL